MIDIVKNIDKDCAKLFFLKEWTVLLKKKKRLGVPTQISLNSGNLWI